jgi:hypothetical protein
MSQPIFFKWIALIEQQRLRAESFIYDGDRQRVERLKGLQKLKQDGKCVWWVTQIEAENPDFETIPKPDGCVPIKLKTMVADLGDPWEGFYNFTYMDVSKLVHPSGSGSHTYFQDVDEEKEVSGVLNFAVGMHYYLTDTVLSLLGLETFCPRLEKFMEGFITHRWGLDYDYEYDEKLKNSVPN